MGLAVTLSLANETLYIWELTNLAVTLGTMMDKQTSMGGEDEETNLSLANEKLREKKVGKTPYVLIF